jgi:hypothetical protein
MPLLSSISIKNELKMSPSLPSKYFFEKKGKKLFYVTPLFIPGACRLLTYLLTLH